MSDLLKGKYFEQVDGVGKGKRVKVLKSKDNRPFVKDLKTKFKYFVSEFCLFRNYKSIEVKKRTPKK